MQKKTPIAEILKELGLPASARFLGYVVHLRESQEFLASTQHDGHLELYTWSKTPELAKVYPRRKKPMRFVDDYRKGSEVALLFDVGNELYVASSMAPVH